MGVFAALLRFFEDSFKTTLIPDLTQLGALVAWRSVKAAPEPAA